MAFMVYRIIQNPADFDHWGRVFWLMYTVTTAIGVVLAVFVHPRVWCTFCPMGTIQSALDRGRHRIVIDAEKCIECRACEKACPMLRAIIRHKAAGTEADRDCLRCCQCCNVCPKQALRLA
jgi:ferredoxin-type protein NapH